MTTSGRHAFLEHMQHFPQILLIVSFVAFSWLAFMETRNGCKTVIATDPPVIQAVSAWPNSCTTWTALARNPHPQLVAWGGPVWGALLPVVLLITARRLRSRGVYLFRFFAGFCLIANGLYLLVDSFGRGGDGGTLIRTGASPWELLLFGVSTCSLGFWFWHGLGQHFGLGSARGRVSRGAAVASMCLLAVTVAAELRFYPL